MSLARIEARIKKAALDLQISDPSVAAQLRASQENKFLDLKLRARALKQRLRQRLISRRFEQERLERAYRSARLGKFELFLPTSH
jgi:SOS response regulatory protein OraA/RecX